MLHQNPKGSEVISLSYDPSATTKNRTLCKARGIPPLGRTPNALPAPQAPAYLPMAKARGITQDLAGSVMLFIW